MDPLPIWLTRLARLSALTLEERCGRLGLTASEVAVLGALRHEGAALSPTRLQGVVVQSPGGVTKTLRRLEAGQLVRRRADPGDRRALLVELTAKGRRAADRAAAELEAFHEELLVGLDRAAVAGVVRSLLDRLEPMAGMPSTADVGSRTRARR